MGITPWAAARLSVDLARDLAHAKELVHTGGAGSGADPDRRLGLRRGLLRRRPRRPRRSAERDLPTIEERAIPTIYGSFDYAIGRDLYDCGCFYPIRKDREIGQGSVA
jgi:hypothetical protein